MSLCQSPVMARVQPAWWRHMPFRCDLGLSAIGHPADKVTASALRPGWCCSAALLSHTRQHPQSPVFATWHLVAL